MVLEIILTLYDIHCNFKVSCTLQGQHHASQHKVCFSHIIHKIIAFKVAPLSVVHSFALPFHYVHVTLIHDHLLSFNSPSCFLNHIQLHIHSLYPLVLLKNHFTWSSSVNNDSHYRDNDDRGQKSGCFLSIGAVFHLSQGNPPPERYVLLAHNLHKCYRLSCVPLPQKIH